jgi:hypothetical protein
VRLSLSKCIGCAAIGYPRNTRFEAIINMVRDFGLHGIAAQATADSAMLTLVRLERN